MAKRELCTEKGSNKSRGLKEDQNNIPNSETQSIPKTESAKFRGFFHSARLQNGESTKWATRQCIRKIPPKIGGFLAAAPHHDLFEIEGSFPIENFEGGI